MKKLMLFCFIFVFGLSSMAQSVNLKLNLEKNKVYRLRSLSDQTVTQTVNGVEQTTTSQNNVVLSIKMVDETPDLMIAEVRFDTIITKTNAMGKMMIVNSSLDGNMASEETADVMTAVMNRLSRNALYVKFDGSGKVIDIVNAAMLRDIILKDTGMLKGPMAPILKTQIINAVEKDALKSMIESFTYTLPGREVKTGETWNLSTPMSSGGMSLDITSDNKLQSVNNNMAVIVSDSKIKVAINAKPMEYSGAKITYDGIIGLGKTQMTISTVTGLVIENSAKTTISGDLNVSVQGMSMQIPMKVESESAITSIE